MSDEVSFTSMLERGQMMRADESTDPSAEGLTANVAPRVAGHGARGMAGVEMFLCGRWREAAENLDDACANLGNDGESWQPQASLYALDALLYLGDLAELRRRHARLLAAAEQRRDLLTTVQLHASHSALLLLAADDGEAARRQMIEARAGRTQTPLLTQDWRAMCCEAEIELYAGEGGKAYQRFEQDAPTLSGSHLLGVPFIRASTAFARGRAAIASIESSDASRCFSRLAEARWLAIQLQQERTIWASSLAAILKAALQNAVGDAFRACAWLEEAAELARTADMSLYAAACQHQLGLALGGPRGSELLREAYEIMSAQEIRVPARFSAMLVPTDWDLRRSRAERLRDAGTEDSRTGGRPSHAS